MTHSCWCLQLGYIYLYLFKLIVMPTVLEGYVILMVSGNWKNDYLDKTNDDKKAHSYISYLANLLNYIVATYFRLPNIWTEYVLDASGIIEHWTAMHCIIYRPKLTIYLLILTILFVTKMLSYNPKGRNYKNKYIDQLVLQDLIEKQKELIP